MSDACPCGTGLPLVGCCGPLLSAERLAETAEELMRSRYTAYTLGDREHLWRTWDPRTRPQEPYLGHDRWTGLQVREVVAGGPGDEQGVVDFVASFEGGRLAERSRFVRRAGRWFYTGVAEPDGPS